MTPLVQATSLTFTYGRIPALRGVSLTVAAGEVVMLIGPNGSGKSTLIKSLLGYVKAAGVIEWEGRPLRKWGRRELARRVAYLPQAPSYDPEQTVAEVLRLGKAPYWRVFGLESDRDTHVVADVARRLSLDELLDRRMDALSGGQRQRAFLGRCLAQEPKAMLLDEPNTHLDLRHQVELSHMLRKLAADQGIAVLMASHDINLAAAFADRLILLDQGAIAKEGPPSDVLDAEVLSRVYGLPLKCIKVESAAMPIVLPDAVGFDAR